MAVLKLSKHITNKLKGQRREKEKEKLSQIKKMADIKILSSDKTTELSNVCDEYKKTFYLIRNN